MQSEDLNPGTVTPEPVLLITRLMLIEDCGWGRGRRGGGGRGGERGEGREHLWTRELVVYTEVKIKAAVVNEISEESEIKCVEERETQQSQGQ